MNPRGEKSAAACGGGEALASHFALACALLFGAQALDAQDAPPSGWARAHDPNGSVRWWDGQRWTDALHAPEQGRALEPPARTSSSSTPWIWWIVLLQIGPLLVSIIYYSQLSDSLVRYLVMFSHMSSDPGTIMGAQSSMLLNPWLLADVLVTWAVYGLTIWFAYRDRETLIERGVTRPFHWAWTFAVLIVGAAGLLVYIIGRAVVVYRQRRNGLAPLWTGIAVVALQYLVFGWFGLRTMQTMMELFASFGGVAPRG